MYVFDDDDYDNNNNNIVRPFSNNSPPGYAVVVYGTTNARKYYVGLCAVFERFECISRRNPVNRGEYTALVAIRVTFIINALKRSDCFSFRRIARGGSSKHVSPYFAVLRAHWRERSGRRCRGAVHIFTGDGVMSIICLIYSKNAKTGNRHLDLRLYIFIFKEFVI